MIYRDSEGIYRAASLERFSWLIHGFGTRLSAAYGHGLNLATLRQTHSDRCVEADGRAGVLGEGDALIGHTPGIVLGVKTADCLPVLLVDERTRAVGAVHAGWRGTARRITAKTVERMVQRFGSAPEDLHAAIGPGIGPCCFEVGAEVAVQFGHTVSGKVNLDLVDENRWQLLAAGIAPARIYVAGRCTACSGKEFHSYRRDRERAGRMLSIVGIQPL